MVFFNYATMQMAAKIVYYGPGLCGKTTNLHHIYTKTSPGSRGEMVSLETETDRTLFFDLLPIDVGVIGGFKTRLQLYTVPGQVFYNTTRKLVLKGVDGIVFVCDSQMAMLDANIESLKNLRENLLEIGVDLDELPVVLQLNKRDLPSIAPVEVMLDALDADRKLGHVEAVASTGVGVFETLKLISKLTLRTLRRRMTSDEPARAVPPARAAQFKVRDDSARTMAGSVAVPVIDEEDLAEMTAASRAEESAPAVDTEATIAAADIDRHILSAAPVPEAPEVSESTSRPVVEEAAEAKAAEPEIEFSETEKPQKIEPAVKTVKVRSSVDVMAELESLRKRATQTNVKAPRRDVLADLESLRPKRDLHRTLHVQVPHDALSRARSVRVTLSFEDSDAAVVETRDQQLELGDTSDVQSLSVNLKIDLA
jgi:mutual gliding-motility protein MglA